MKNLKFFLVCSIIISFNSIVAQIKYGFINIKNEIVIPAKFDNARSFSNGLAAVKINNLWGFINTKGEMVIAPQYGTVFSFKNQIAKVSIADIGFYSLGPYIYINTKGEVVSDISVPGDPVFFAGLKLEIIENGKIGFKNNKNVMVIPAIYDYATDFNEFGWTICKKNGKMGCINTKGEIIIPFEFNFINDIAGNYTNLITENGENRIYNIDGTFIKVDGVDRVYSFNKDGIAGFTLGGKTGFLNTKGKILSPARFEEIGGTVQEGLAKVTMNGQLHVLDILNDKILCTLTDKKGYGPFINGLSAVEWNGKYGIIDKNGKTIIPFQYLDLGSKFEDGLDYFSDYQRTNSVSSSNSTSTTSTSTTATSGRTSNGINYTSYALDIFKSKGAMAIYVGQTMYVVTIKDKDPTDIASAAAKAAVKVGITSEYKYQWFAGSDCVTLKDKYSRTFTVKCGYELSLD